VESLHNGAKILLAYFHYCNKGAHPFSMDWTSPEQVARGELNAEQVQFLQETAVEVEKRGEFLPLLIHFPTQMMASKADYW
jgi:hypothetical protein